MGLRWHNTQKRAEAAKKAATKAVVDAEAHLKAAEARAARAEEREASIKRACQAEINSWQDKVVKTPGKEDEVEEVPSKSSSSVLQDKDT